MTKGIDDIWFLRSIARAGHCGAERRLMNRALLSTFAAFAAN